MHRNLAELEDKASLQFNILSSFCTMLLERNSDGPLAGQFLIQAIEIYICQCSVILFAGHFVH